MPRRIRATAGGMVYHVLNRGVGRMRLFRKAADFADRWAQRTAKRFGLESTFRPQGRPSTKAKR